MGLGNNPIKNASRWLTLFAVVTMPLMAWSAPSPACATSGIALQVLGSGGPIADDGRASSSYLVWVDGHSRFLIDAGGGAFLRFAEAGGNFADLEFLGISHFHADHSADLPALLKSGYFSKRTRALVLSGPSGNEPFPGLHDFVDSMIGKDRGAYRYLSGYIDGTGGLPVLNQIEVAAPAPDVVTVFENNKATMRVSAMNVPHGIVPAVAFRIEIGDVSIVFASDQNGSNDKFVEFTRDATMLVMHMPVPEGVSGAGRKLHAPPSVIGEIAADANVRQLLISHFMSRSLKDLEGNIAIINNAYSGQVHVANDLYCTTLKN